MEDEYFNHEYFGNCKILGIFKGIALIELENQVEKYVVAVDFSKKDRTWNSGYYFKEYKNAISAYAFLAFN